MRRAERVALVLLALLSLAVILVPALASRDPLRINDVLARRLVPPFATDAHGDWHVLGTDRFGRDMLVRMMLAGRLSLLVGVVGSLVAGVLGTLLGEPYLSVSRRHEGLLLHSVYHRPNGWDSVPQGRTVPCCESSMWGDYHLREAALYVQRLARREPYLTFWGPA